VLSQQVRAPRKQLDARPHGISQARIGEPIGAEGEPIEREDVAIVDMPADVGDRRAVAETPGRSIDGDRSAVLRTTRFGQLLTRKLVRCRRLEVGILGREPELVRNLPV